MSVAMVDVNPHADQPVDRCSGHLRDAAKVEQLEPTAVHGNLVESGVCYPLTAHQVERLQLFAARDQRRNSPVGYLHAHEQVEVLERRAAAGSGSQQGRISAVVRVRTATQRRVRRRG